MVEQAPVTDHSPQSTAPPDEPQHGQEGPQEPLSFWQRWGELFMAVGVLVLGIVVLVESQDIRVRQGVVVSPRIIPQIVGAGLVLVAIWYVIDVIRGPHPGGAGGEDAEDVDPEAKTDWSVIGIIAIGLVAYAALMEGVGFIVASAVLFVISAFAMGSRRIVRDVAIGTVLAVGIFLLFDRWLGVRLPDGWVASQL
ncbi:MAG TPA: tripartite tricarboxylate transporter TctB family protein [Thermomicrobiales bacterium]|nr:tripartite tricarboxylate transporter TctB family protein [Thermomicrobiales bacterium]